MLSLGKKSPVMIPLEQDESLYAEWATDNAEEDKAHAEYRNYILRKILFIVICLAALIVLIGYGITIGGYKIGFFDVYETIINHLTGNIQNKTYDRIVCDLRMPRIIAAIIAGAGLAIAGAAMQSTMKNPLADPYTTGISSGAAFGATLAICFGFSIGNVDANSIVVVDAFVFSLVPTAVIIAISMAKKVSPVSMILAGIAVMYIFNALTTVIKLWADPDALAAVYRWTVGSLYYIKWTDIPVMLTVTVVGSVFLMLMSNKLNILSAGDDSAKSLGINANRLRVICLVVVSLIAASIVSFTGVIGFIGLVAPHIARIFVGSDNRYLIPASLTFGAAVLLLSDIIGRTVLYPNELQVGVVTAFLGGPLFLYLILRKKEAW